MVRRRGERSTYLAGWEGEGRGGGFTWLWQRLGLEREVLGQEGVRVVHPHAGRHGRGPLQSRQLRTHVHFLHA